jgi:thioester reductase-like protein
VRTLIQLSAESSCTAKLAFVSSVGVAERWHGAEVPEEVISDFATAAMGYGQSKLVAENLLAEAASTMGVPVMIVRVGQIAGPVGSRNDNGDWAAAKQGMWKRNEWFPTVRTICDRTASGLC